MIVSKPKFSTLFSLLVFLALAYSLSAYLLLRMSASEAPSLWMTIMVSIAIGAALAVTYKTISGYKTIYISKNRIDIHFAFSLIKRKYYFKELLHWQETVIKTASGLFKELTLHFEPKRKVKLTMQENSHYEKVKAFMKRNFPGKQQK